MKTDTLTLRLGEEESVVDFFDLVTLVDGLVMTGLCESNGAARRVVRDGGAYVNNVQTKNPDEDLREHVMHGKFVVLRKGKKNVSGLIFEKG